MELYDHQKEAIERVREAIYTDSFLISHVMGRGKTIVGAEIVSMLVKDRGYKDIIVTAPPMPLKQLQAEFERYGIEASYVSRQKLALDCEWRTCDLLLIDEGHEYLGERASLAVSRIRRKYTGVMSGTPHGNSFGNSYELAKLILGAKETHKLYGSYIKWMYDWAVFEEVQFAPLPKITGEKIEGAFFDSLPLHIKDPGTELTKFRTRRHKLEVSLSPEQRRQYDIIENESIIDDNGVYDIAIQPSIRLHQSALATLTVDPVTGDIGMRLPSTKVDAITKLCSHISNAFILTSSRRFAELLHENLPHSELMVGGSTVKKKQETIERMNIDFRFLIGVYGACSTGIDGLQHKTNHVIVADIPNGNPTQYEQALARIAGVRQQADVNICNVICLNTKDTGDIANLHDKSVKRKSEVR